MTNKQCVGQKSQLVTWSVHIPQKQIEFTKRVLPFSSEGLFPHVLYKPRGYVYSGLNLVSHHKVLR